MNKVVPDVPAIAFKVTIPAIAFSLSLLSLLQIQFKQIERCTDSSNAESDQCDPTSGTHLYFDLCCLRGLITSIDTDRSSGTVSTISCVDGAGVSGASKIMSKL